MDQKYPTIFKAKEDTTHILVKWPSEKYQDICAEYKDILLSFSRHLAIYQKQIQKYCIIPAAKGYILYSFFITLTNRVIQKKSVQNLIR